jgi:hypothetical protein
MGGRAGWPVVRAGWRMLVGRLRVIGCRRAASKKKRQPGNRAGVFVFVEQIWKKVKSTSAAEVDVTANGVTDEIDRCRPAKKPEF